MANNDAVERIKERLSIVDVVAPYVELHQAGRSLKGKSPFTNEKTPSFFVTPDKGMYYCFSTSKGGDMFTFLQEMEGVDFKGALKMLAEKAGVELVPEDPKKRSERDQLYAVLTEAAAFFESTLSKNAEAADYLRTRGVTEKTKAAWRLGYAPDEWRALRDHLKSKGFSDDVLRKAGLVKGEEGKDPYDVFRDRVMFPIFDASGRVVAFSGRLLSKETEAPKYVNSPETELFNKSEILYGYHAAREGMRSLGFALIVEGQFDVVLSHQAGYKNAAAVSGTALTPHHVALLQRLTQKIVLALDSDKAGIAAVKRAASVMLPRGVDLKVAHLPDGQDPADLIQGDVQQFKSSIGKATHVVEFLLEVLRAQVKDDRAFKLRVQEEVLPLILLISNAIDREHFEGVVATSIKTTKDAVHAEVERLRQKNARENTPSPYQQAAEDITTKAKKAAPEDKLTELAAYAKAAVDCLEDERLRAVATELLLKTTPSNLVISQELSLKAQFETESQWETLGRKSRNDEVISRLELLRVAALRRELDIKQKELTKAEVDTNETEITTLLTAIAVLHKRRESERITLEALDISV